jgi:hypothetical protein
MRFKIIGSAVALAVLAVNVAKAADRPDEKKAKIRQAASETLQDLYRLQPSAQGSIQKATGYAVFKNFGTNLLVVSTASGAGVATSNQTKQEPS